MKDDLIFDRPMPTAAHAEALVLGHILVADGGFDAVSAQLDADCFATDAHRRLFRASEDIVKRGAALNRGTLALELQQKGMIEAVGGLGYLVDLGDVGIELADVTPFCRAVKSAAIRRRAILLAQETMERAFSDLVTVEELVAGAETRFRELAREGIGPSQWQQIGDVVRDFEGGIDKLLAWRKHSRGIPTPWPALNRMTGGLQRGELVILAAAPGQGKTALAMQTAQHAAQQPRGGEDREFCTIGVVSLEMDPETIYPRVVAQVGRVDATAMSWGSLSSEDRGRAMQATRKIDPMRIYFDRANSSTPREVRARVAGLNNQHFLDLLIIDNLSLMKNGGENRNLQIAGITREMKLLAKELHIPVVILVHLSRDVEKRNPPRPVMSDLRDSGAIAQDADIVLLLFRPEAYIAKDSRPDLMGVAELIIGKQRNGQTGTVNLIWRAEYQRFDEREYD